MRPMKKIVLSIGAAIIVAPIFSSALAQNQQTQTLLEMQALRDEVGQLRDMIERQGYTIRQLERRLEQGQPSSSDNSQYSSQTSSQNSSPNSAGTVYTGPNNSVGANPASANGYVPGGVSQNPAVNGPSYSQQADVYQGAQAPTQDQELLSLIHI